MRKTILRRQAPPRAGEVVQIEGRTGRIALVHERPLGSFERIRADDGYSYTIRLYRRHPNGEHSWIAVRRDDGPQRGPLAYLSVVAAVPHALARD